MIGVGDNSQVISKPMGSGSGSRTESGTLSRLITSRYFALALVLAGTVAVFTINSLEGVSEQPVGASGTRGQNAAHGQEPGISWLMSFPNSGTSFTSQLIRHVTNTTTAANYGPECDVGKDGMSVPVYADSPSGPYVLHPSSSLPPPDAYILAKTHCGGRCATCEPHKYIETKESFKTQCLSGNRVISTKRGLPTLKAVTYDEALVGKAVHVIRNPFDNIVARFHLEQKERKKKSEKEWMDKYSNDPTGFQAWCSDQDARYKKEEASANWKDKFLPGAFEGVLCHAEFFRFVQWHNYAVSITREMNIPILIVHYEDYTNDFKGVLERLLEFLELEQVGEPVEFVSGKDYSAYFTTEQRIAASKLMNRLSTKEFAKLSDRYHVSS